MQLTQLILCSLDWISSQSTVLMQLTQVTSSPVNGNLTWVSCFRAGQKLPNQHGTTWAVTSTVQWADCFWEWRLELSAEIWPIWILVWIPTRKAHPMLKLYITSHVYPVPKTKQKKFALNISCFFFLVSGRHERLYRVSTFGVLSRLGSRSKSRLARFQSLTLTLKCNNLVQHWYKFSSPSYNLNIQINSLYTAVVHTQWWLYIVPIKARVGW